MRVVFDFITEFYGLKLDIGSQVGRLTLRKEAVTGDYSNYSYPYLKQKVE